MPPLALIEMPRPLAPARNAARRPDARLLHLDARAGVTHWTRRDLPALLCRGDLLVVNDAATLPASLHGTHDASGAPIEVRLAARGSLDAREPRVYRAVLFGRGDWRTTTEAREPAPRVAAGDMLSLGLLRAEVLAIDEHPRLVWLRFEGSAAEVWSALVRSGRPIQYSHHEAALDLWDVQTVLAGPPVSVEPASAGLMLDDALLRSLIARGVRVARLTHAAGLSSTGDRDLDARLPLPEPYFVPEATRRAVAETRAQGARVIALGTTVVRALESASEGATLPSAGPGMATLRIGPGRPPRAVDAVITGMHEPESSHHALLEGFAPRAALLHAAREAEARGYLAHEFGDACLVERSA